MNIPDVGDLSLGQWAARVVAWNKAHGSSVKAPSAREFEEAVMAASLS